MDLDVRDSTSSEPKSSDEMVVFSAMPLTESKRQNATKMTTIPPKIILDECFVEEKRENEDSQRPRSSSDTYMLQSVPHSYRLAVPSDYVISKRSKSVSCPSSFVLARKEYASQTKSKSETNSSNEEIMVPTSMSNGDTGRRISLSDSTRTDQSDSVSLDPLNSNCNIYTIPTYIKKPTSEKRLGYSDDDKSLSAYSVRGVTPTPTDDEEKRETFKKFLTIILSCTYAIFILMLSFVVYVTDIYQIDSIVSDVFNIFLTVVGVLWMAFVHVDIRRMVHKSRRMMSITYDDIYHKESVEPKRELLVNHYSFQTGRHSGSFYLKIGAAAFCFGHLIHEGLLLSRQIIYLTSFDKLYLSSCFRRSTLILDIIHPIFSFYQLFILFKYSNVVINRFREMARFALMHIIATNFCFWVHTIIRETSESIQEKLSGSNLTNLEGSIRFLRDVMRLLDPDGKRDNMCMSKEVLSHFVVSANRYLYPFSIEYSLLAVGIWFVIWHKIGSTSHRTDTDTDTQPDVYTSNLVIHIDCHSANRGLFAGLLVLLVTVISVIVFYVLVMDLKYVHIGTLINNVSDISLHVVMSLVVIFAYRQTSKLDLNMHAVSFLDDILLLAALPCFFLFGIFNVMAGIHANNIFIVATGVFSMVQVTLQTPFIIDGLRRCSNTRQLRYHKPGRELVTFLIVCNLAVWILETFEIKSFETQIDKYQFYGKVLWTLLSHITMPLTLFYRFHSSVCLVDIWKSAYERGE